jgi:hypothetical protein
MWNEWSTRWRVAMRRLLSLGRGLRVHVVGDIAIIEMAGNTPWG